MKAVLQRVERARVLVEGEITGEIGPGILALVCAVRGDGEREAAALAERVARYRIFADADGKMNVSALDRGLAVLVVSQFTLAADGRKGRRPSFDEAAPPEIARALVERFTAALAALGLATASGRFGAMMRVELVNVGPATFLLDEPPPERATGPSAPSQVVA